MSKRNYYHLCFIICFFVLFFVSLQTSQAEGGASFVLLPASETFKQGEIFSVELELETEVAAINAARAIIYFPADKLEVKEISKDNSIFVLWPEEPLFNNRAGTIVFSGGLPQPGFQGKQRIIKIVFEAKAEGMAFLSLGEGQILANDGKGTDILAFIKEAKYLIGPTSLREDLPLVYSPTHASQGEWYNNNNPVFKWQLSPEMTAISFVFDQNPGTVPIQAQGKVQSASYQEVTDGIWYFHWRAQAENDWLETSHYKVQIDNSPPRVFQIAIDNAGDPTNPNPSLYFQSDDDLSGIDYYKLKVDQGAFANLFSAQINPFSLPYQGPGSHQIVARAVDKAGNNVETKTALQIEPIASPQISSWPELYLAGEETLYLSGTALPQVEVTVSLAKQGKLIAFWQTVSDLQGEWSLATKQLFPSDNYTLSAQAKDSRGAVSNPSSVKAVQILLSGLSLGPLLISAKHFVVILSFLILLVLILGLFLFCRYQRFKKALIKETKEVKLALEIAFDWLEKESQKKIAWFDAKPGLSKQEKELVDQLKKEFALAEKLIKKEIKDIENLLS